MKVKIGDYKSWFGCYQLAEKVLFWKDKNSDAVMALGDRLSGKDKDSLLSKAFEWANNKRKRTIEVHIDKWDTWGADYTLALIILPVLKQLKKDGDSAPFINDDDVPEELRSTNAPAPEQLFDVDANYFKRWYWVLDEMVFAFEHMVDDHWEAEFRGINYASTDWAGIDATNARINNGLILFGKYYRGLWI
jgi:hypothetical protein